jgi:hypothetical protein
MAALPSCSLYDAKLLEEASRNSASGGSNSSTGGDVGSSGGTTSSSGGLGGSGDGGIPGVGSSNGETGGMGMGGAPDVDETLVDDMELGSSYVNLPFSGAWARYDQTGVTDCKAAVWASATVSDMFVADGDNQVLHVAASDLDCWGVDVAVTLQGTSTIDLSEYTAITFMARRLGDESLLTVRLEDDISRDATCEAPNCYKHAESSFKPNLTEEWKRFEVPLSVFVRDPALDLTTAHAIHFAMDPVGEAVDFQIDDIYLKK